ncbi:MAG: 23S rRNA (guanosine(2251)-2'-O)-methyltransferase RlmB [Campylobacteraceae bacterium]
MIIYGKQLFLHLLNRYPKRILNVFLAKECDKKLFSQIARLNVPIERLDSKKAQALARGGNHQGFLAQIEPVEFASFDVLKKEKFLVMLVGVTDVGNIGAIVRSIYAFGVDGLIISGVKQINMEGILRTSSAAAFELPICLMQNELDTLNELKQVGFELVAADMSGENVKDASFKDKKVLIMGSEGDGLNKKVLNKCDKKVSIRMKRVFDSLNVSVATAILCDRMSNG